MIGANGIKEILYGKYPQTIVDENYSLPETKEFSNLIELDSNNYIKSSEECTTNIPGIFVAGDVREKKVRQLTTAMNDGTIAALNVIDYLKNEA